MKRLVIAILSLVSALCLDAQVMRPTTTLLHKGKATTYLITELQNALDAAESGDTILLNNATYPGCTIRKPVMIIGTGTGSVIGGNVIISITNNPAMTTPILYGLKVSGSVDIQKTMKSALLRKVYVTGNFSSLGMDELSIDRCTLEGTVTINSAVKKVSIDNSYLGTLNGQNNTDASVILNHCAIWLVNNSFVGTVINSFVRSAHWNNNASLTYSVYGTNIYSTGYGDSYNSYSDNVNNVKDSSCKALNSEDYTRNFATWVSKSVNAIQDLGYFGNDDTVIGYRGGEIPLENYNPTLPKITTASFSLDQENRTLSVDLKVNK